MSDGPKPIPADIDSITPMRFMGCAVCGVSFAVPAKLYLLRADSDKPIHCPNGHPNRILSPDQQSMKSQLAGALAELGNVRTEGNRLRAELAALRARMRAALPLGMEPSTADLRRRARVLANTALVARRSLTSMGGVLCPICGTVHTSEQSLYSHIWRRHRDALKGPITGEQ